MSHLAGSEADRAAVQVSSRTAWVFATLVASTLLAAQVAVRGVPVIGADDANIFLTYGRNLSQGHGWVYTRGFERVEGTTSFLYTLLAALASATGWPELVLALVNIACFVATLRVVAGLVTRLRGASAPVTIGWAHVAMVAVWPALHPGLSFWCGLSLLDAALWTWLVVAATSALLAVDKRRGRIVWPALCVALALTRPESVALVPALGLIGVLLARRQGHSWSDAFSFVGPGLVAFAVTAVALTTFRVLYFGHPLPNTYYAKVGSDWLYNLKQGTAYAGTYLSTTPLSIPLLGGLAFLVVRECRPLRPGVNAGVRSLRAEAAALAAAALVVFVLPIVTGGDHFGQGRFLTAATLLLPIPAAVFLRPSSKPERVPLLAVLGVLLGAGFVHYALANVLERGSQDTDRELMAAERGRRLGRALDRAFAKDARPSVGAFLVGGLGYEYDGRVVDLLGLNNLSMAHASRRRYGPKNHAAFDRRVFYELSPLILPVAFVGPRNPQVDLGFVRAVTWGLLDEARFQQEYVRVLLSRRDRPEPWLEDPDFFVPSGLRGFWRRSEGRPDDYRFLMAFVRRPLLDDICGGRTRSHLEGAECDLLEPSH